MATWHTRVEDCAYFVCVCRACVCVCVFFVHKVTFDLTSACISNPKSEGEAAVTLLTTPESSTTIDTRRSDIICIGRHTHTHTHIHIMNLHAVDVSVSANHEDNP